MSGGLAAFGDLIANLAKRTGNFTSEIERATDAAGRLPKDVPVATPATQTARGGVIVEDALPPQVRATFAGFGSAGRKVWTAAEEAVDEMGDAAARVQDALDSLRSGGDVGDLVLNQRDLIDQIQETPFGKYLDRFAELYLEKLQAGFALSPERNRVIEQALYAQNIGAKDIIKRLAGTAGQKFNFYQFEQDLKALFEAQKAVAKATNTLSAAASGASSGTLGKGKPESCQPASSLSILQKAGALR